MPAGEFDVCERVLIRVDYSGLALFLAWRAQGLPVESTGVRR